MVGSKNALHQAPLWAAALRIRRGATVASRSTSVAVRRQPGSALLACSRGSVRRLSIDLLVEWSEVLVHAVLMVGLGRGDRLKVGIATPRGYIVEAYVEIVGEGTDRTASFTPDPWEDGHSLVVSRQDAVDAVLRYADDRRDAADIRAATSDDRRSGD